MQPAHKKLLLTLALALGSWLLLSIGSLIYPGIMVISLISIIGMPLGLLMMVAVPVLLYITSVLFLWAALHIWEIKRSFLLACVITAALGFAIPLYYNLWGNLDIARWQQADLAAQPLPNRPDVLVFTQSVDKEPKASNTPCDFLCQQLLFQHAARVVGIGFSYAAENTYSRAQVQHPPRYFTLHEQTGPCPRQHLSDYVIGWIDHPAVSWDQRDDFRKQLSTAQETGHCIIEVPAQQVTGPQLDFTYTKISGAEGLSAGIASLKRVEVWLNDGAGSNQLLLSNTRSSTSQLNVPLVLTLEMGSELRTYYQWYKHYTRYPADVPDDRIADGVKNYELLNAASYLPSLAP